MYIGEDEFIHADVIGDQGYNSLQIIKNQIAEFAKTLRAKKKQVRILGDLTKMTKQDSGARKGGYDIIAFADYDKIAVFGASPFLKNVANLVAKFAQKTEAVKFFRNQEEAVEWLKS